MQEYGGLWKTSDEMKKTLDDILAFKEKDAVIAHIKYHKFVLGTKPHDKTQLQSGKEKFTYEQLVTNFKKVVMTFSPQPVSISSNVNISQQNE